MTRKIKTLLTFFTVMLLFFLMTGAVIADEGDTPLTVDQLNDMQVSKSADHTAVVQELTAENGDGVVRLIVKLATAPDFVGVNGLEGTAEASEMQKIDAAQSNLMVEQPGLVDDMVTFEYIPYVSVWVDSEAEYAQLLASENVLSVVQDVPVPVNGNSWSPAAMADANAWINTDSVHDAGFDGSGYTVAILDTGVDKDHYFLDGGKVVSEACYSTTYEPDNTTSICAGGVESSTDSGSAEPYAGVCPAGACDHGTHVAGIAAGTHTNFTGIAPDANIIAIQVFSRFAASECGSTSDCAMAWVSDQMAGLERVYNLRGSYNIAAVNMSLGGKKATSYCDGTDPRTTLVNNLAAAGIATVISAGNSYYRDGVGYPGCISTAYTIGATYDTDSGDPTPSGYTSDGVTYFSNADADMLDMWAPGFSITSSIPTELYGAGTPTDEYNGTSMSAPIVAGAFAVYREMYPSYSLSQLWAVMTNDAVIVSDNRPEETIIFGSGDIIHFPAGDTVAPRINFPDLSMGTSSVRFPKNNYEITTGTSLFKWTPVSGATHYYVEIIRPDGNRLDILKLPSSVCDATICQYKLPYTFKVEFGSYQWRVQAADGSLIGSWSDIGVFDYIELDTISGYTPSGNEVTTDHTPTFTWEESAQGVYRYQIEILNMDGTLVLTATPSTSSCSSGICSWTVSSTLPSGEYKWRVFGKKYPNGTPWSATELFTIQ